MEVYKTKGFSRFARKELLEDEALQRAIEAAAIKPDADLGGGLIKQRVARRDQGKSGSYRTIIAFRRGALAFFVYGFAKSDRDNISAVEERALRKLAAALLETSASQRQDLVLKGELVEVVQDD